MAVHDRGSKKGQIYGYKSYQGFFHVYCQIAGVLNESYIQDILRPEFLSDLENDTVQLNDWKKKHNGRTPSQSLRQSVLEHVGRPIYALLR